MADHSGAPLRNVFLEHEAEFGARILQIPDKKARLAAEQQFFQEIAGLSQEDLMAIRERMTAIAQGFPYGFPRIELLHDDKKPHHPERYRT